MRCPVCGDPVEIRGNRWECGWCTNFGDLPRSAAASKPPSKTRTYPPAKNPSSATPAANNA